MIGLILSILGFGLLIVAAGFVYRNYTVSRITSMGKGSVTHVMFKPTQSYDTWSFSREGVTSSTTRDYQRNTYLIEVAKTGFNIESIEQVKKISYSSKGGFKVQLDDDPRVERYRFGEYLGSFGIRDQFFISGETASDNYQVLVSHINDKVMRLCLIIMCIPILVPLFMIAQA